MEIIIIIAAIYTVSAYLLDGMNDAMIQDYRKAHNTAAVKKLTNEQVGERIHMINIWNPFLVYRLIAAGAGYGRGYAPKLYEAAKEITQEQYLDSKLAIKSSQQLGEVSYKTYKSKGTIDGAAHFDEVIAKSQAMSSTLKDQLQKASKKS